MAPPSPMAVQSMTCLNHLIYRMENEAKNDEKWYQKTYVILKASTR